MNNLENYTSHFWALLAFTTFLFVFVKFHNFFSIIISKNYRSGVQNISNFEAPRITGIAFFISFTIFSLLEKSNFYFYIIFSSFFLFIFSIIEDMFNNVVPKIRFVVIIFSCFFSLYLLDNIPTFNSYFFSFIEINPYLHYLFYTICLATFINGSNIIDGSNGTLAVTLLASLSSMLLILDGSNLYGNELVGMLIYIIFCLIIFLAFNYPLGLIFLGDSSAYLVSMFTGIVLFGTFEIVEDLNPFFALLVLFYPCCEVIFSFIRKYFFDKTSPFNPDKFHLHLMVYFIINNKLNNNKLSNNLVMPILTPFTILPSVLGFLFYNNSLLLLYCFLFFIVFYIFIYYFVRKYFEKTSIRI
jgi:UDP-N-acetylmuramyl pentapeptide phosphotransferase/UDP-N-acetylglucosamine-1-phosphate transferase